MQIPALFYGLYRDVKLRFRKLVRQFSNGEEWDTVFSTEDNTDTMNFSGFLVLNGPSSLLGSEPHFHCYVLLDLVRQAVLKGQITSEQEALIFEKSLLSAWGVLGLLSYKNVVWFWRREQLYNAEQWSSLRYQPMLIACLNYWDVLDHEGARYTNGSRAAQQLWELHTSLKYILANLGVSTETLLSPLPPEGLTPIIASAQLPL